MRIGSSELLFYERSSRKHSVMIGCAGAGVETWICSADDVTSVRICECWMPGSVFGDET